MGRKAGKSIDCLTKCSGFLREEARKSVAGMRDFMMDRTIRILIVVSTIGGEARVRLNAKSKPERIYCMPQE